MELKPPIRELCAYTVLALFVLFFLSDGVSYHYNNISLVEKAWGRFPDFSNDQTFWTLSFMASHNITGVRGNHDQKVIEWRAWIHWIRTQPGGPRWLEETHAKWSSAKNGGEQDPEDWLDGQKRKDEDNKWWKKIPPGWILFGAHFAVAQDMSEAHYDYLRSLPYIIHIPSAHAFIVHGGLLASNPKLGSKDSKQPLARIPKLPKGCHDCKNKTSNTLVLRTIQEQAILTQVPQNNVAFNVLNMRSIVKDKVSRNSGGKPWSKIWKEDMLRCGGFDGELENISLVESKKQHFPCYPATVVYGHSAGRGLDVKRWSVGLDTGCVYERHLTALVLGGNNAALIERDVDDDEAQIQHLGFDIEGDGEGEGMAASANKVKFGDSHHGTIVKVRCP
ncbi:hypothetical protein C0991_010624 [Blastosporella zonata]|nr:hypothetical protein C0991_010624 [Blastosporella zonata]